MSDKDINRWQDTILPRDPTKPWKMGSGGSFDMADVQPIPDSMLEELARYSTYMGAPWNCRSLPLSPADREYMFMLSYSMMGLVSRMRRAERRVAELEESALLAARPGGDARRKKWYDEGTPVDESQVANQAAAHPAQAGGEKG